MEQTGSNTTYAKSLTLMQVGGLLVYTLLCNVAEMLTVTGWMIIIGAAILGYLRGRVDWIWYAIAASPAMEVWARMSRARFVPEEMGKYFLLLAITLILLHRLRSETHTPVHYAGRILFIILLPSLVVSLATFSYDAWVFNALGIIELLMLLILAAGERWDTEQFSKALQYALYPFFGILIYMTLKTPSYEHVDFRLNANTTGGFGSNQVSTILGAGMVLSTLLIILKRPFIAFNPLNFALIGYMLFRGLMTFSRGGMVVAILAIVVAFLPNMLVSVRTFFRYFAMFLFLVVLGYGVFNVVNNISGNQLLLRYMGETAGTLDRTKEKNINSITSGRADIVQSDISIFSDNPVFGVGIGNSGPERERYGYEPTVAHTEFSRLLSEQGIGGGIVAAGLILFPFIWVFRQRLGAWRGITAALFVLALLTTFHAAMRTNTSIVFYALAAIPVFFYKTEKDEEEQPG